MSDGQQNVTAADESSTDDCPQPEAAVQLISAFQKGACLLDSKELVSFCPMCCAGQVHPAKPSTPQETTPMPGPYPACLLPA